MLLAALMSFGTMLLAPLDDGENGGGTGGGAAGAPPKAGEQGGASKPFAVFTTQEDFNERLARASRSELRKQFGTDDVETIKARMAKLEQMEKDEAEREKAKMTEIERVKAEKLEAEAKAREAQEEADRLRLESHIAQKCSKLGIRDVGYATYLITRKTDSLGKDEQLDVEEFLAEELKDKSKAVAFGIAEPVVVTQVADPASTSPKAPLAPPPPPPGPAPGSDGDAFKMDDATWQKRKAQLGIL